MSRSIHESQPPDTRAALACHLLVGLANPYRVSRTTACDRQLV